LIFLHHIDRARARQKIERLEQNNIVKDTFLNIGLADSEGVKAVVVRELLEAELGIEG
jgi:hypothetical protein